MHGASSARLYALSQQDALDRTAALCIELNIDADLEYAPAYTYTRDPQHIDEVRDEAEAARRAGLDASFVTDTELPFEVAGAVRVAGQLHFHPRKFLLSLAEKAVAAGGADLRADPGHRTPPQASCGYQRSSTVLPSGSCT
ncbi:FAD-dependent oxidoreductase [Streptomyces sp. NBC_00841]|nr:FAD-dependent oxidoreductase [Streptomyces sp. NBC_00841]